MNDRKFEDKPIIMTYLSRKKRHNFLDSLLQEIITGNYSLGNRATSNVISLTINEGSDEYRVRIHLRAFWLEVTVKSFEFKIDPPFIFSSLRHKIKKITAEINRRNCEELEAGLESIQHAQFERIKLWVEEESERLALLTTNTSG